MDDVTLLMRLALHSFAYEILHLVADDDVPSLFMLWVIHPNICILMILLMMLMMMRRYAMLEIICS